jgi:predicted aconitase
MTILSPHQSHLVQGSDGAAMAMRIVADAAQLLGAERLIPVASAHIDGALYHGDSGTYFAERLVELHAKTKIRATLNVGALDFTGCSKQNLPAHEKAMAKRLMQAYIALGCEPSWTCAPYQAGHRPKIGTDVAWGESNAVVFCNSVLGARTNRYGDFLDIACAISGFAPDTGLHRPENRIAKLVIDVSEFAQKFRELDMFYPVFGTLFGRLVGSSVAVITGLEKGTTEDQLKAFGAAAASAGGVGLFHMAGVTPEAPTLDAALGGHAPEATITVTSQMLREARNGLSTVTGDRIDAVAIGSPHLSLAEMEALERLVAGRRLAAPIYANTGRHVLSALQDNGRRTTLEKLGVIFVIDTCVVVTPILPKRDGAVLMTNSGKFAHYAPGNTGYGVIYGALEECVASAVAGRVIRDEVIWN